jgi:peptide/nickel transport system substrate-binding protein
MTSTTLKCVGLAVLAAAAAADPVSAQTVRFVPQADLRVLDTAWTTAAITRNHGYLVYEPLFSYDSKMQPKPQAVENFSVSPDGLKWTLTLRPGQKFSDGSAVTAKDAVASLTRWSKRKASGLAMSARLASMNVVNDRTFELVFKERFGLVLETLSDAIQPTFVLPEKDATPDPFTQIQFKELVGSGPFSFAMDEWKPGNVAVYKKNPHYVRRSEPADGFYGGKVVKVDRVEWVYLPDPNTAVQALIRGEVDVMEMPPTELLDLLKRNQNVKVDILDPIGNQAFFRFNSLHAPLNTAKGRQAIQAIIDQGDLLAGVIGNKPYERPCMAAFGCGTPNATEAASEPFRKGDLNRARALLKEAGYNNEPVVILDPTDQHILHNMAQYLAGKMREAGINVDLQAMDWGTVITRTARPENAKWHIQPSWAPWRVVASPLTSTQLITPCDGRLFNGNPCDEAMEKLRLEFMAAPTLETRQAAAEGIQKRFMEIMPYGLAGQFLVPKAWRANVTGVVNATEFLFWNIEKK